MKNKTFAPVLIPTLCRYEHFKRCIESLSNCTHADKTDVYIGLDYPAKDSHWEGYLKIKEYLKDCGNLNFKSLNVVKREYNYGFGPNGNLRLLRNDVFKDYDRCICSEDDNEFSPCFLDFMNKVLDYYKDDLHIASVSGYSQENYASIQTSANLLYLYDSSAWGIGLWRNKDEEFLSIPRTYFEELVYSLKDFTRLFVKFPAAAYMLFTMIKKGRAYGDTMRTCYNIVNDTYQIRPKKSLVRNHGNDGSGMHCKKNKRVAHQPISDNYLFDIKPSFNHLERKKMQKTVFYVGLSNYRLIAWLSIIARYCVYLYWRFIKSLK